jgi:hypothetical protein
MIPALWSSIVESCEDMETSFRKMLNTEKSLSEHSNLVADLNLALDRNDSTLLDHFQKISE